MKQKNITSPTLCISIAKQSGMFGTIVHNAGYEALNLNFFYKAFSVDDLKNAILGVKSLGIRGYVKNQHDGSVYVTAQGETNAIDNFVKWCYKGPPAAIVRDIEKVSGSIEAFHDFNILY